MEDISIPLNSQGEKLILNFFSCDQIHMIMYPLSSMLAGGIDEEDEKAADEFARNTLIPDEDFTAFTDCNNFSHNAIVVFARRVGIEKGIVVGRLQKESYIGFNVFNDLKQQYEIVSG